MEKVVPIKTVMTVFCFERYLFQRNLNLSKYVVSNKSDLAAGFRRME